MKVIAIALNTFREAVRDKVLYSLIFFALIMIGVSSILDRITVGQVDKLMKDFGLGAISLFGVMISIFVGIGLVFKEIDKRTIYTIIAKPIYRWEFLLGKYAGLLMTLAVEVLVMTAGLYLTVYLAGGFGGRAIDWSFWRAILLIYVELSLITAIAMFFSSFSTPFMSGIFTLSVFVIGHLTDDLYAFSSRFSDSGKVVVKIIYYSFPNLEWLNIKGAVVHLQPISWMEIAWRAAYGIGYGLLVVFAAMLIFQKREFK